MQEQHAPVADACVFGEDAGELAGIGERQLDIVDEPPPCELDLVLGDGALRETLEDTQQRVARGLERRVLPQARAEIGETGLALLPLGAENRARQARFDERLVQPPRRHVIEQRDQHVHGGVFGMGPRGHVVERRDELHVARAPQRDRALSVLGRFHGIGLAQRARRLGDPAEALLREPERVRFLELARYQQHRVVRLVVVTVERPKPLDRHVLDVRPRPDDRFSVVVPEVGARRHALAKHVEGAVLSRLELVAHHGHFRVEVAPGDGGVDHAVGFDIKHVVEGLFARREGLEVIGPVERGAAVVARPAPLEVRLDARKPRRAAEHQVLQKMRHARFAVPFVPRADEVSDVDRDGIDRAVGDQQDLQAVR